jgi:cystathionine beta-lyase/cystathionine gamma-synthase
VYYPTLTTNPQYELAKRQMKQGGGLLSVELNANRVEDVEAFCDALKYFVLATSWGGHESLCLPMCALKQSASLSNGLGSNFVRLYVGLEDPELLINDLDAGLHNIL